MAIDTAAPRSRRALLFGALGGALASVGVLSRPRPALADDPNDLVLEATNNTDAQTELLADTASAGLRVVATGIGLQGWGDIGVDAYGETIGLNAIGDAAAAPAVVAYNRGSGTGVFGWTRDGNDTPPAMPGLTGVYGLSDEDDVDTIGVYGKAPKGIGVRGVATTGAGVKGEATTGIGVAAAATSGAGVAAASTDGNAVEGRSTNGNGVVGLGPSGSEPPSEYPAGVYGSAASQPGVLGQSASGFGVFGQSDILDGVYGQGPAGNHPEHSTGAGIHGHGGFAGVMGTGTDSFGVFAQSSTVPAIYALNSSASVGAIVAEGGTGTAIHGHANPGGANQVDIPASPALTGLYGSATGAGVAIAADSANALALRATSSGSHAIRGRGQLDGVIGESPANTGVVGYSGAGDAPAGPPKVGVLGVAEQDSSARGVFGRTTVGQAVRGEATTSGTGVRAVSATGKALDVTGKVVLNRSGSVNIPANATFVDVTVPGGIAATAMVFATLQIERTGVWVTAARPAFPAAGKLRISLNKVASTTTTTRVAWMVLG